MLLHYIEEKASQLKAKMSKKWQLTKQSKHRPEGKKFILFWGDLSLLKLHSSQWPAGGETWLLQVHGKKWTQ